MSNTVPRKHKIRYFLYKLFWTRPDFVHVNMTNHAQIRFRERFRYCKSFDELNKAIRILRDEFRQGKTKERLNKRTKVGKNCWRILQDDIVFILCKESKVHPYGITESYFIKTVLHVCTLKPNQVKDLK